MLAPRVTPADTRDRVKVGELAGAEQAVTGEHVELGFVDQRCTGVQAGTEAAVHGIHLEVVKLPDTKRGFVLLPRRWVVELSFALASRVRWLARDNERLPATVAGLHFVAFFLAAPSIAHPGRVRSISSSKVARQRPDQMRRRLKR